MMDSKTGFNDELKHSGRWTFSSLIFIILVFLICHSSVYAQSAQGHQQVITDEIDLYNQAAQRPVKVDLWYPKPSCTGNPCTNEPIPSFNLALLSHGAMGAAKDYSWLAHGLVSQGWVVIGLNHFGESWRYGQENIDPSSVQRFWQRAEDVSFALDSLAAILPEHFVGKAKDIVVIGHSSGGYTAAALGGVTLDFAQMYNYCASDAALEDVGCRYGNDKPSAKTKFDNSSTQTVQKSMKGYDARITRIVMLDPALGPAATIDSMQDVSLPTLIIGSQNNDFLPFTRHANYYAENIPKAQLIGLPGDEGHFVYLNNCDHNYAAMGVPLCKDKEGVDRGQVHQQLLGYIVNFLAQ
jgi:predicted dienelactone hydrolase